MGLDSFKSDSNPYKRYNLTDKDEKLQKFVDEFKQELPDDFQIDFIEVSPAMNNYKTWAYKRSDDDGELYHFIRVGESIPEEDDNYIRKRIADSMIRLYIMQKDIKDDNDEELIIAWMAGRLGVDISQTIIPLDTWVKTCQKLMLEE